MVERKAKNRNKGDPYREDVTMDSAKYLEMWKEHVVPAIREKMWWAEEVTVQAAWAVLPSGACRRRRR